jgi:hypothetical protein
MKASFFKRIASFQKAGNRFFLLPLQISSGSAAQLPLVFFIACLLFRCRFCRAGLTLPFFLCSIDYFSSITEGNEFRSRNSRDAPPVEIWLILFSSPSFMVASRAAIMLIALGLSPGTPPQLPWLLHRTGRPQNAIAVPNDGPRVAIS